MSLALARTFGGLPHAAGALTVVLCCFCGVGLFGAGLFGAGPYLEMYDAKGYHAVWSGLTGAEALDADRLAQRGYFFALLGGSLLAISPFLLFFVQCLAAGVSVALLCAAERVLTGQVRLTLLAPFVPSLWIAPARMMTEVFFLLTAATATYLLLSVSARQRLWALPALALGALLKPVMLPVLLVLAALLLGLAPAKRWAVMVLLSAALIGSQFGATARWGGVPVFSTVGPDNLAERFHPAVVGWQKTGGFVDYKDPQAAPWRAAAPGVTDQVLDVLTRPVAAFQVWAHILVHEHLLQTTGMLRTHHDLPRELLAGRVTLLSGWMAMVLTGCAVLGLLGGLALWRRVPERVLAVLPAVAILGAAPLVYWQGDRIVFPALLLMLPFAGYAWSLIWDTDAPG